MSTAMMIPNNTPSAQAARIVQRMAERIDRKATARQLAVAAARREKQLEQKRQAVANAEKQLHECEYAKLQRQLADARRDLAETESIVDGAVKSCADTLLRDAQNDPRVCRAAAEAASAIDLEIQNCQNATFDSGSKKWAVLAERLQELRECRRKLDACMLESDPLDYIRKLLTESEID